MKHFPYLKDMQFFCSKNRKKLATLLFIVGFQLTLTAQFVHPGLTNKKSDLDRVKYMVESKIDPWYTSYQEMVADSKSSYNYSVRGNSSFTELGRDSRVNYNAWNDDIRAAYYNAIRWYVTEDSRHAEKAIEIFNAWKNLTNVTSGGTDALSGGVAYIMIEAAEIIRSTYNGWSNSEIKDFQDMLVYPGYSNRTEPSGDKTFYWMAFQGDPVRHGNQGLSGFRTVMAIGIFLDNEIIYDRALRYIQGLPRRSDDIAYPSGPNTSTTLSSSGTYVDTYRISRGSTIEDYGYDEVMTNYIYENGQCQESSRDHQHTVFGIGNLTSMAEMAWNQGDDLYSHADDRLLLGLEYNMRYNVSAVKSFSDQLEPWVPTVASGEFEEGFDRTGRWYSKAMSSTHAGGFVGVRPVFEMPIAHYRGRGFKTDEEVKWITRARDLSVEESGYEDQGNSNDAIGWGALTSRRPDGCYGEPISGFDSNGLPEYSMNVLPGTIEAENFDYSPVSGEDRTYNETTASNRGRQYRTNESVDIQARTGGGYNVGWIANGEWLTYTVYVPQTGVYDISTSYAAINSEGKIKFEFSGIDKTGEVTLASTGGNQVWEDLTIAKRVSLSQGVQSMKVLFSGSSSSFNLNSFSISASNEETRGETLVHITKRNAPEFAVDGGIGGTNGQSVSLSSANTADEGQLWVEIDRGNGYYSYEKYGTNFSLDGNRGGANNQEVYIWQTADANLNQQWQKVAIGDGGYQLVKRNATGFAINGGSRGVEGRNISLYDSSNRSQNLQWYITPVAIAESVRLEAEDFDAMSGIETEDSTESGENVAFIHDGDWIRFDNVNLFGITNMDARVSTRFAGGTIEVRIGSVSGALIGEVNVENTGGHQNWTTVSTEISSVNGTEDVYLVFTGGRGFLYNVNWVEFNTNLRSNKNSNEISTEKLSEIIIYPNPIVNTTTIENAANSNITIYDMNGVVVYVGPIISESEILDLSTLASGLYYAEIIGKGTISVTKIIKE